MPFFRRKDEPDRLSARLVTAGDRASLVRLVHTAEYRFLTAGLEELPDLLQRDPTAVLVSGTRIGGVASFGWRARPVAWLRTLLFQEQAPTIAALRRLSAPLYDVLGEEEIDLLAVTLDEWNDAWLRPALEQLDYRPMVEVIGYAKRRLDRPASGNQAIGIRPARPADLPAVLVLDAACFPLPWVKGAEILGPALATSPCFLLATLDDQPIGYALVTGHQGGALFHLVRIAVLPAHQGTGIGVRLLAEVVDFCAARGADILTLNTQADNYVAQRLYEWFGFVRTGDHQTVLGLSIPRL